MVIFQDSHIAYTICKVYLISTNDSLIEIRYLFAIIYLLLGIQVDCSIINSQLILSEKWNCSFLQVEEDDLCENLCTIDFFLLDFYLLS